MSFAYLTALKFARMSEKQSKSTLILFYSFHSQFFGFESYPYWVCCSGLCRVEWSYRISIEILGPFARDRWNFHLASRASKRPTSTRTVMVVTFASLEVLFHLRFGLLSRVFCLPLLGTIPDVRARDPGLRDDATEPCHANVVLRLFRGKFCAKCVCCRKLKGEERGTHKDLAQLAARNVCSRDSRPCIIHAVYSLHRQREREPCFRRVWRARVSPLLLNFSIMCAPRSFEMWRAYLTLAFCSRLFCVLGSFERASTAPSGFSYFASAAVRLVAHLASTSRAGLRRKFHGLDRTKELPTEIMTFSKLYYK